MRSKTTRNASDHCKALLPRLEGFFEALLDFVELINLHVVGLWSERESVCVVNTHLIKNYLITVLIRWCN